MAKVITLDIARKSYVSFQLVSKYKDTYMGSTIGTTANTITLASIFLQLIYHI